LSHHPVRIPVTLCLSPSSSHPLLRSSTAPPPPEFYPLSLHDALPISLGTVNKNSMQLIYKNMARPWWCPMNTSHRNGLLLGCRRSEEHTSELQSRFDLVCRLLLEKKKNNRRRTTISQCNQTKCARRQR